MKELWRSLKKWFLGWLRLGPHFVVGEEGDPYLLRWYIIPRNPWINVYLHQFLRDDTDRALHDHPWNSLSFLLWGRYFEECPGRTLLGEYHPKMKKIRSWSWFFKGLGGLPIIFRKAQTPHRIELIDRKPAWTLFVTGPRIREWGFHCPKGWVHFKEFTSPTNYGNVGKGCGEMS